MKRIILLCPVVVLCLFSISLTSASRERSGPTPQNAQGATQRATPQAPSLVLPTYGYTYYGELSNCAGPESAIILNMSGGQKFDISTAENGIQFDLNLDGKLERIASPLEADVVGFLYLENNLDHNGRNLFGNRSPQPKVEGQEANGFLALRNWDDPQVEKDANGKWAIVGPPDGKITPRDGVWKNLLRVWFDLNRNGLKDAGELKTLDELNIVALETNYQVGNRKDNNGNVIKMIGKFWKANDPKPYFMVDYCVAIKLAINESAHIKAAVSAVLMNQHRVR